MKVSRLLPLVFLAGCATPKSTAHTPLTPETVGPAFAEYSITTVDKDGDKVITEREWVGAGGTVKSFSSIDTDRDGKVTIEEIQTASSTDKFFTFAKKTMDTGGNTELTPVMFRSPAGAKLFAFDF